MTYQTLNVEESEDIITVTLNRPVRRNALNPQMIEELIQVMDDLAQHSSGVMILTGTGTTFCAGLDLENLKSLVHQTFQQQRREDLDLAADLGTD